MNSESRKFFREPLGSLDTCHHSSADQILITIDVFRFPTCQSPQKESRGSEVDQRTFQYLKTDYGAYGHKSVRRISLYHSGSPRIIGDYTLAVNVTSDGWISQKLYHAPLRILLSLCLRL